MFDWAVILDVFFTSHILVHVFEVEDGVKISANQTCNVGHIHEQNNAKVS